MKYSIRVIPAGDGEIIARQMRASGIDAEGVKIMSRKARNLVIRVDHVPAPAANIIKQQLLSLGQDAAVHRDVISGKPESSTVYIISDRRRLEAIRERFAYQPFGLKELGVRIEKLVESYCDTPEEIPLRTGKLDLSRGPVLAGILNVTPDSFSDGGEYLDPSEAVERARQMAEEGASIIDIGAESSRPGAARLETADEIKRVKPVLEKLAGKISVPLSIDTRSSEVARLALDFGAEIINDISGLGHDPLMAETAAEAGAAVIVMHMKGTPETMQKDPGYEDPVGEILEWLERRTAEIIDQGVKPEKIIIDPGIGFGKRLRDNIDIIREISSLEGLGFEVMVGYSRKSYLGKLTGRKADSRIWGGLATLGWCLGQGVRIFRVHDVAETMDFIKVWNSIRDRG